MNFTNLVPALSGSFYALLAYFVLVFCLDIAFGVIRSMVALWRKDAAKAFQVKGFDWDYLGNFAKSQLMSPPLMAIGGTLVAAFFAPDGSQGAILALASAALFAQALILTRDIFNKIRQVASLAAFKPAAVVAPAK